MTIRAILAVLLAALPVLAPAEEARLDLSCADGTGRAFEVALGTPGEFGPPLHCIRGLDLGVAACAPDGGWGLSTPGGERIDRIATEAKGLAHIGGWFFARVTPTTFIASASIGADLPYTLEVAGGTFWRMTLDLATTRGSIFTRDGEVPFACD